MEFSFLDLPSQLDKVAVVTGGNKGIGYETAKALCKLDAHVILGKRLHNKFTYRTLMWIIHWILIKCTYKRERERLISLID